MRKSARGACGSRDGAVRTQKIDGSMWSTEMEPTFTNLVRSYLYGTFVLLSEVFFQDRYIGNEVKVRRT